MAYPLVKMESIGKRDAASLAEAGVHTTDDLLEVAARPKGRGALAEKTGIGEEKLLDWANRADLMRIPGLGAELVDLLAAIGVTTVPGLKRQRPAELATALKAANDKRRRVGRVPGEAQCAKLVAAAKGLRRMLSY